jgi:multidrug resistance protein MdtO
MSFSELIDFLRRELAPTPGRGSATFRLTLACVVATIPILTHRIPHALVIMVMIYLITQEDTAATLLGSILGVIGATVGLGLALLALMVSVDIAWLRVGLCAAFLFGGLFLKRVLVIGALGSAMGLPAALVMMLPDLASVPHVFAPSPELLTEFALWIWLCIVLGLAVNLAVQLLLAPGDPLTLLQAELDTRLRVVAEVTRGLGDGAGRPSPSLNASLRSLATAGMSRPLALLKTASLTRAWARQRREELSTIITLVDRLVTDAGALVALSSSRAIGAARPRLLRVAEACQSTRQAFVERHRPAIDGDARRLAPSETTSSGLPPLDDMERVLDQIALAVRVRDAGAGGREAGPHLLLPDALTNPEYVRFAIKGTLAALICYVAFIGFDYPGIYTSVITCFVVSLSTIGSSNQKGLLRFGGAVVGGVLGLLALVYAFPNIDGIGGFWLVFGAGTAIAAWVNFGTPRISYGGYQIGVAFYKAVLQGFGPAVSATVVRDRLIGVFFGLIVFGIVEHVLWPVRATDRMRERLADALSSLADLALSGRIPGPAGSINVEALRTLISQQITDVQGFIESSKFESGADHPRRIERLVAEAQIVFLILLAVARHETLSVLSPKAPGRMRADVATSLRALAERVRTERPVPPDRNVDPLSANERSVSSNTGSGPTGDDAGDGLAALDRELVVAVKRLTSIEAEVLTAHRETRA